MTVAVRVTVWGENVHEHKSALVAAVYPATMHGTIAAGLNADPGIIATTATLQDPEHGLTAERLAGIFPRPEASANPSGEEAVDHPGSEVTVRFRAKCACVRIAWPEAKRRSR